MSDDFNTHEVTLSVRVFDVEDVKEAMLWNLLGNHKNIWKQIIQPSKK